MWYKQGMTKINFIQKGIRLKFLGLQRLPIPVGCWMPLWNVEEDVISFPLHGTVTERALRDAGYFVPNPTGYQAGQIFTPESR